MGLFRVGLGCCMLVEVGCPTSWVWVGLFLPSEFRSSARRVRSRPPPLTPADGHHRCFWLRHRLRRAPCARRHRASTSVRRAACCVDAFLWLSSTAFCVPAGGSMCRLMCHCVRHIGLDNKHGRSVEAIHSFLSRWKRLHGALCWHTEEPCGKRRARWGARTVRGAHPGFGSPP